MAMNFREPKKRSCQVIAVKTQLQNVFEEEAFLSTVGILRQQITYFT